MDNRKIDPDIKAKYGLQKGEGLPELKKEKVVEIKEEVVEEPRIKKDKAYYGIDESFDEPEPVKEESLITNAPKDEEQEYLIQALKTGDENVLAWVKYNALGLKQKEGKSLTQEEQEYLTDMNKLYALEKENELKAEQQIKENEEIKAKVLEDYNKTKLEAPHKIDVVNVNQSFHGSDSLPKLLKFALIMKSAKKKGGKLLVKVTRDRNVIIEWTKKELSFVEFWTTDEKGTKIPEVTRFNEYKYNYEGSPVPVLFAIQGYAEGFDFFGEFRKDITSEMVSRIASRARHSGFLEGINQREQGAKQGMFAGLEPFMPLIIIGGFAIMIVLMYMMYGEMTNMLKEVEAMKQAIGVVVLQ